MVTNFKLNVVVWLIVSLLSTMPSTSFASSAVDTSSGKVAVDKRGVNIQRDAIRRALEQVVIKLTGQQGSLEHPSVKAMTKNANRYLRSYRYGEEAGQLYLFAEFERQQIEAVLVQSRLPLWGARRPDGLFWLVVENDQGSRTIMTDNQDNEYAFSALRQAKARGVPLIFPLMDLDDTQRINAYDVWGLFPQQLNAATQRYNVDFVVAARIYINRAKEFIYPLSDSDADTEEGTVNESNLDSKTLNSVANREEYTATGAISETTLSIDPIDALNTELIGKLVHSGVGTQSDGEDSKSSYNGPLFTQEEFSTLADRAKQGRYSIDFFFGPALNVATGYSHNTLIGDDPQLLITQLINRYADYLGQRYAVQPSDDDQTASLAFSVGNLNDLTSVVEVQRYLQSLSVTENVVLVRQQGTVSTFQLDLLGNEDDLRAVLNLDERLQPLRDAFGQPLDGMHYFWNR